MVTIAEIVAERGVSRARVWKILQADGAEPVRRAGRVALFDPERVAAAFAKVRPGGLAWRKSSK